MTDTTTDPRREASRLGLTRESAGEWRNLAARYDRLGRPADAAECRARADAIVARFPHLGR